MTLFIGAKENRLPDPPPAQVTKDERNTYPPLYAPETAKALFGGFLHHNSIKIMQKIYRKFQIQR